MSDHVKHITKSDQDRSLSGPQLVTEARRRPRPRLLGLYRMRSEKNNALT